MKTQIWIGLSSVYSALVAIEMRKRLGLEASLYQHRYRFSVVTNFTRKRPFYRLLQPSVTAQCENLLDDPRTNLILFDF